MRSAFSARAERLDLIVTLAEQPRTGFLDLCVDSLLRTRLRKFDKARILSIDDQPTGPVFNAAAPVDAVPNIFANLVTPSGREVADMD
jgi:hypothetical protein